MEYREFTKHEYTVPFSGFGSVRLSVEEGDGYALLCAGKETFQVTPAELRDLGAAMNFAKNVIERSHND